MSCSICFWASYDNSSYSKVWRLPIWNFASTVILNLVQKILGTLWSFVIVNNIVQTPGILLYVSFKHHTIWQFYLFSAIEAPQKRKYDDSIRCNHESSMTLYSAINKCVLRNLPKLDNEVSKTSSAKQMHSSRLTFKKDSNHIHSLCMKIWIQDLFHF